MLPPPEERTHRTTTWMLALILLVAAAARLTMAARVPFMFDEYLWASLTDEVMSGHWPIEAYHHPAGQAYWNTIGIAVLGPNAIGYRIASVLLGVAAVGALYLLGAAVWDRRVGLFAAFLLAVNEYHLGISTSCFQKGYL